MKKQIEKPEVKVMKLEAMDVIATSLVDADGTGVILSTSRATVVTGTTFE